MEPLKAMEPFLQWIDNTSASLFIQRVEWVIPMVQTVHILMLAVVLSSVGMIVLRLMGWAGLRTSIAETVARYMPWIWGAIIVMLLSGTILVIGEPHRELTNPAFQLKMLMVIAAVTIMALFQRNVRRHPEAWNREPESMTVRLLAVATLLLLFAIAVAGRWIAYIVVDYTGA